MNTIQKFDWHYSKKLIRKVFFFPIKSLKSGTQNSDFGYPISLFEILILYNNNHWSQNNEYIYYNNL